MSEKNNSNEYERLYIEHKNLTIRYNELARENKILKDILKDRGIDYLSEKNKRQDNKEEKLMAMEKSDIAINNSSPTDKKIELYMSLFRGREDVYARRWEGKDNKSGYVPVCANENNRSVCRKYSVKCSQCEFRLYAPLDKNRISNHLSGREVAGIYPLLKDNCCYFLAIDFDDEGWKMDVKAVADTCREKSISFAVERSRSGSGAHIWFFFSEKIKASMARKFGSLILTHSMNKRYKMPLTSYDRLFPNQDVMPQGGFGNLIALPLQKSSRNKGNSEFIDDNYIPYPDQWEFLCSIKKLSKEEVERLISELSVEDDLGDLMIVEDVSEKPWERKKTQEPLIKSSDFPLSVNVVLANMIYIEKTGISDRALNKIKRLAAFRNPEFYKAQAMRQSTYGKPRIISLSEESGNYLALPRGCDEELFALLSEKKIKHKIIDERNSGRKIKISFRGNLRENQEQAFQEMIKHDKGVLYAGTAFGKTVVGMKIIAEKAVNTLIIVRTKSLLVQWLEKISEFLDINEAIDDKAVIKKRGRNKNNGIIGQIGGGKNNPQGIIDVAMAQSLIRNGKVREEVNDYGMIIVDECQHVSAFTLEKILKRAGAKYVYGLTATPYRSDGHDPIIFMQCGTIRFRVDPIKQAIERPFEHYVIPRFTPFRLNLKSRERDMSITDIYTKVAENSGRNEMIISDIISCINSGRNPIILSERTAHVKLISEELMKHYSNVISLSGQMSIKKKNEALDKLKSIPKGDTIIIVSTGKLMGEGFDEPRLDTLFLVMPVAWKGTIQQYAGRLHRLCENKRDVVIYDYVDIHVNVLERMYQKRLKGYSSIGYSVKSSIEEKESSIYKSSTYYEKLFDDMKDAKKEIVISSPIINKNVVLNFIKSIRMITDSLVNITIITRDIDENYSTGIIDLSNIIQQNGLKLILKKGLYKKFAVIDRDVVWYGSINILGNNTEEESIMRLKNSGIACELVNDYSNFDTEIPVQQRFI